METKILKAIDKNAKLSVKELAEMLGESEEKVQKELERLESERVICGYPTLINWDKVEEERVTALIEVKVTPQRGMGFDRIAERIYKFDEVEALYLMSGSFDLSVTIVGKTLKEVAEFVAHKLAPMEAVVSTSTSFVLKKYKQHGMTLVGGNDDERMLITP